MGIDIFSTKRFECRNDNFGLYDDESEQTKPAIVVPITDARCIARVRNEDERSIYFVPLDKNISASKTDGKKASLCDVLLIVIRPESKYDFYLVELKDKDRSWLDKGINQLKSTVLIMKNSYSLSGLSKKAAYLANKKHPQFHFSHKDEMERFRQETGFRLIIEAEVKIK
jgi:hypothetical protein